MTIVELFDEKPINNVVGTLAFNPDKVVYVGGYSKKQFETKKLPVLMKYFNMKGFTNLEVEYVQVRRDSFKDIVDKFEGIYSSNAGCVFHVEVTGGEDLILIGLGALSQRHPEIELYQISSKLRTIRSFTLSDEDGKKLDIECKNSDEENLLLHGASIITANGNDWIPGGYNFDNEFKQDIDTMWNICCRGLEGMSRPSAPNSWNKVATMLASLDAETSDREDKNSLCVDTNRFKDEYMSGANGSLFYDYICYFVRTSLKAEYTEEVFAYDESNAFVGNQNENMYFLDAIKRGEILVEFLGLSVAIDTLKTDMVYLIIVDDPNFCDKHFKSNYEDMNEGPVIMPLEHVKVFLSEESIIARELVGPLNLIKHSKLLSK